MKTRIDRTTIVTCQGSQVAVLEDASVAFEDGVITQVGPTAQVAPKALASRYDGPPLEELRGRPIGAILIKMGAVTPDQLMQALDRQKAEHGITGRTLLEMGFVTEADIEFAIAAQTGRRPQLTRQGEDVTVIDGSRCLVIPGLINTHHHLYQSLTRGMKSVQNASLFEWLTALYPRWRELDSEILWHAATISIAELLLNGCTTTSDHHYLFPADRDVKLEAVLQAAEAMGIRIHACRGSMSLGASAGGLPPDACVENEEDILRDCARVIDTCHDPSPMAMRRIDLAPCSPFSVTPELLDQTRALAAERGVLMHTHIAETLDEERFCLDKFGVRPIEYLRQREWLGPNVYLAHCVHLNDEEIRTLAQSGTGVAHCPSSNMRLGSGIPPIRAMLDAGVKVGLAVDGSSSNDGGNLLAELRQAVLLQRVKGPARMTGEEAFRLGTAGGADVLNRPQLGRIAPGMAADLVMFDTSDVAMAGVFAQDPVAAITLAQPPRPRRVFVAGKQVVEGGRIARVDWPKVVADFNQLVRTKFKPGG